MVSVQKRPNENTDGLFRRFSRDVWAEDLQQEARDRRFYLKPSQVRKEKEKNRKKSRRRSTN